MCQLEEYWRPTRVLGGHINLVEVLLETTVIEAVHLHHMASNPLTELHHGELLAQAALAVAVHDVGEGGCRENFVNGGAVELFTGLGARVEVRHAEANAVRVALLDVFAALHNRRTRTHHVVEHDDVFALDFFDADVGEFRVEGHADFTFAGTDLVHHHALALGELQSVVHGVHEGAGALVRRDNHEVVAVFARLHEVAVLDVVGVGVRRDKVVEVAFENFAEEVLHLDAVVVDRHHGIDAGGLEQLGVKEAREGLAVELLQVDVRAILLEGTNAVRAAVLGAIEQVRFNEHHLLGTVVLGGAGQNAVTHGVVVTAAFMVRNRANQDDFAFEAAADMLHVSHIQHVAGAEFGVGEGLQGDHVGDVFTEADVLGHVDGERVIGEVAGHDKTI